jgi:hypothetical protein
MWQRGKKHNDLLDVLLLGVVIENLFIPEKKNNF